MGNPIIDVELEKEHLVMYGLSNESPGCVLRGVLNIHFKQPTKVKNITLRFIGTIHISWTQNYGNGREQYFEDEKIVMNHQWTLFTPPHGLKSYTLNAGTHSYEFELPLKGDLPETIKVGHYYIVQYRLKALIQRPHVLPNYAMFRPVFLTRQPMSLHQQQQFFSSSFQAVNQLFEPISVTNQWVDKVDYCISLPSKTYHHGDTMRVHLRISPLIHGLTLKQLIVTFKEYASCKPVNGWFGGASKSYGKIIYYTKINQIEDIMTPLDEEEQQHAPFHSYSMHLNIPISSSFNDIQCDTRHHDVVRVRHKLKFILSFENADGHLSELRAILPVIIQPKSNDLLPTYEQSSNGLSFPYNPNLMLLLLRRNHHQGQNNNDQNNTNNDEDQTNTALLNALNPNSSLSNLLNYHQSLSTSLDHDIQQQRGTFSHHRFSFPSFFHRDHPRLPNYDEVQCH
ncbi:hypothetical protein BJ944DRAFT_242834 [Cunninghamella echinulata]|nr:hypothetical protein BJ944DRAFT_242834 [Cunninghamella echinulata]